MCPEKTTFATNQCISCNIEHCKTCQTADICFECLPSFTLNSNTCECPHSSYIVFNNACVCPSGTSPSDPSSNCTGCLPTHCNACDAQNECIGCSSHFALSNNVCICSSPFVLSNQNKVCDCQMWHTFYNSQCIECHISQCKVCNQPNKCMTC